MRRAAFHLHISGISCCVVEKILKGLRWLIMNSKGPGTELWGTPEASGNERGEN